MQHEVSDNDDDDDDVPYDFAIDAAKAAERYRARVQEISDADDAMLAEVPHRQYTREKIKPSWPKHSWAEPNRREFSNNTIRYVVFDALSRSSSTARINPLDAIRVGTPFESRDSDRIAECLLGIHRLEAGRNASFNETHFLTHGSRVLSGLILHGLYTGETERSLAGILRLTTDPAWYQIRDLANEVIVAVHDEDQKMGWVDPGGRPTTTHPGIVQRMRSLQTATEGEQSGIYTTAVRALAPFSDPLVAFNTSTTDFDFDDLFNGLTLQLRVSKRAQGLTPVYETIEAILADRLDERLEYGPLRHPSFLVSQPMISR